MAEPTPIIQCLADLKFGDNTGHESAYRRGYHQGMANAIDSLEGAGVKIPQRFLVWYDAVGDWRYKRHHGSMEFPPEVGRR